MPNDNESCILISAGPSCQRVLGEEFPGKTVIAVNAVGPLRNFRVHWWVTDGERLTGDETPPKYVNVLARAALRAKWNAQGMDTTEMRVKAGAPATGYANTACDALILASYLGYKRVEVYGADWSNAVSLRPGRAAKGMAERYGRMRLERDAWHREATRSGITVLRAGPDDGAEPMPMPVASVWQVHWVGERLPKVIVNMHAAMVGTNDARRAEIVRLTGEIAVVERFELWLQQLAALGLNVPVSAGDCSWVETDAATWERVGPGVRAEIEAGRLLARVEEKRLFAPAGVA